MLKILGFVRRNERISHDEYRAGHVGFHNSYGRRLKNIRGYILNIRANRPLEDPLGSCADELSRAEPEGFADYWSGFGQLMFDHLEDYFSGRTPALDKPGPSGLEYDDRVTDLGGDLSLLFANPPIQFHVAEQVLTSVCRPEHKMFKVLQFGKRRKDLPLEAFQAGWTGTYGRLAQHTPGLLGLIVNFPTSLEVMVGFFSPDTGAFDTQEVARRKKFLSLFDGIAEYWWESPEAMVAWRFDARDALRFEEEKLFESSFFCEVDETVAVLPDRSVPPPFYHR